MSPMSISVSFFLYFAKEASTQKISKVDPDWLNQGWYCQDPTPGHISDCIKVIPGMFLLDEADRLCAAQKRPIDLNTPTLIEIDSKEEEELIINSIAKAAGIVSGGNIDIWVGPGSYRDSKEFSPNREPSIPSTTQSTTLSWIRILDRLNSDWLAANTRIGNQPEVWSRPSCGQLRIDVLKQSPLYTTNATWNPKYCTDRSRVVCRTRKVRLSYLLGTLADKEAALSQKEAELSRLYTMYSTSQDEVAWLRGRDCGCSLGKALFG